MMKHLLWRGMLAGALAALVAATFALWFAEPAVDGAIAVEAQHAAHAMMGGEEELVSRATQKGAGLYTAMLLYGSAMGGLFAVAFASLYGRVVRIGPRSLALLLAVTAFVVVSLVPALKYPPTPPAVGMPETVQLRTADFFAMLGYSVLAAVAGLWLYRRLHGRLVGIDRVLAAIGGYLVLIVLLQLSLPAVDEVPEDFPATLLWQFRLGSLGAQAVFWAAAGIAFGWLAERLLLGAHRSRPVRH
ncbi:CbtA family protein [Sphingomonas sp. ac-8]|uniref:CbtA family protein n=1 Tax=Sphingomonas sp. ac-8 TaxID=3242977 RepID=UPI003A7F7E2F